MTLEADSSQTASEPSPTERTGFVSRVLRAARLHADTYEEIEADPSSLRQAMLVVGLAALASAGSTGLRAVLGRPLDSDLSLGFLMAVLAVEPFVTWLLGSAFAYMVGATFFKGPETETDYAEVLRTTGFAFGPGMLALASVIPPDLAGLVVLAISRVWVWIANIVAIRQALDFTTLRAIGTLGVTVLLLWLVLWGLALAPLPG